KCKPKLNVVEPATASSRSAAADGAGAKELAGKAAQNTRQLKRNARYRRSGGARLERCSKQFELLDSSGPPHPGGPANPAVVWSGWVIARVVSRGVVACFVERILTHQAVR